MSSLIFSCAWSNIVCYTRNSFVIRQPRALQFESAVGVRCRYARRNLIRKYIRGFGNKRTFYRELIRAKLGKKVCHDVYKTHKSDQAKGRGLFFAKSGFWVSDASTRQSSHTRVISMFTGH